MRNRPISCCATGWRPIPPIPDKPADVKGVPEVAASDIPTAIKFCRTAGNSSRRALYQLGRAYAANRQMPEAIAAWRKAADKGSTSAMVELGVLYATGAGVAKDDEQARKLFERAAQAGNPRGVTNLAALSGGGGAPADPARARELLAKAAETNAEAQYQLGLMLADGTGGEKDDAGARACSRRRPRKIIPARWSEMGEFAEAGRGGPKDKDAAKGYYERAAALGDEDAKKALERHAMSLRDQGQARQSRHQSLFLATIDRCHASLANSSRRRGNTGPPFRLIRTRTSSEANPMIRKLQSGEYRLYSRKVNPKTGKRRNLGTFKSRAAAEKHERDMQYFKRH